VGKQTIVVVEDNDAVREVTTRVLLRGGYAVLEAAAPSQAIEIFHAFPYPIDLVLTDIVMPKMSGLELAKRLQSMRPEIALVFMSGYSYDETLCSLGLAGPVTVVAKPFQADQLLAAVREALDTGRRRSCLG
jgi:two-component system cell cycle sensor histidine kinase/response regulator CckA